MNPTSKKFISLFLALSLMMLSGNLLAKERRGAKLLITKKDGQQIEGELITVKPNSLLLLNTEGKDESIDIADIRVITIVKKSKVGKGALYGLLIGGVIGVVEGIREGKDGFILSSSELVAMGGLVFGLLGALLGAGIGAVAGTDKTIQIEGMSDSEIHETLNKLRKKARIRDYR
ncbi:hypothetical protein ES703_54727 [subsurface metagenome]